MIRNLISNALKYTQRGRVLVGCRRRQGKLRIEIWDTGIGIPPVGVAGDLRRIPSGGQPRPPAKPRPGPGPLDRQKPGRTARPSDPGALAARKGVGILDRGPADSQAVILQPPDRRHLRASDDTSTQTAPRTGAILIIEDDPEVREHLKLFLNEEGYQSRRPSTATRPRSGGARRRCDPIWSSPTTICQTA